jgi:hypothetical protein
VVDLAKRIYEAKKYALCSSSPRLLPCHFMLHYSHAVTPPTASRALLRQVAQPRFLQPAQRHCVWCGDAVMADPLSMPAQPRPAPPFHCSGGSQKRAAGCALVSARTTPCRPECLSLLARERWVVLAIEAELNSTQTYSMLHLPCDSLMSCEVSPYFPRWVDRLRCVLRTVSGRRCGCPVASSRQHQTNGPTYNTHHTFKGSKPVLADPLLHGERTGSRDGSAGVWRDGFSQGYTEIVHHQKCVLRPEARRRLEI